MNKAPASILRNPVHFLAFGLGSGAAPFAPGTFGTLLGLGLYLLLPPMSWLLYLGLLVLSFIAGIWICGKTAADIGVHDHGGIVWDEFVGIWITLFLVPDGWLWLAAGFALFRLLDIVKPWPIKWADTKVAGGLGIMLDDVLAGIMAALCLQAAAVLF